MMYYLETKNVQSSQSGYTTGIQFYESGVLETAGVYHYALQSGRAGGRLEEGRLNFFCLDTYGSRYRQY